MFKVNSTIMAFSPRFKRSKEVVNLFRLNLNKAKVNENQQMRKDFSYKLP